MKRLVLTALALSMFAAPAAYAGPQSHGNHEVHKVQSVQKHVRHKAGHRAEGGHVVRKKVVTKRWTGGRHVPAWQRKQIVRDHQRYHLRKPGPGQQWVRIGNDYLLISLKTGTIRLVVGR
jgi:Ni/Co efflux regulator RcnB